MERLFFIGRMVVWNNEWLNSWENLNVRFLLAQISSVPFVLYRGHKAEGQKKQLSNKSALLLADHVSLISSSPQSFLESFSFHFPLIVLLWQPFDHMTKSEPSLPSAHPQCCCWSLNQNHLPRPQSVIWLVVASAFALSIRTEPPPSSSKCLGTLCSVWTIKIHLRVSRHFFFCFFKKGKHILPLSPSLISSWYFFHLAWFILLSCSH